MTAEKLRALIALTASPVEGEARNAALAACKALRERPDFLGAQAPVNNEAPLRAEIEALLNLLRQRSMENEGLRRDVRIYVNKLRECESKIIELSSRLDPQQGAAPKAVPTRFARFPARFRGRCQGCNGQIVVGEPIAYAKEHGAYHDQCCPS